MQALVTGADGLLGTHLVRKLLDRGVRVRAFLHPRSDSCTLDGLDIERCPGDLLGDPAPLREAVEGCDRVFHCAAVTDLWADRRIVWNVNLEGTRRLLDACAQAGTGRLVHVGSGSSFAFGPMDRPGDETGPYPDAYRGIPYMESKFEAMGEVLRQVRDRGLDAVVVAPTFLLGRYDFRPSSGELIRQFITRRIPFTSPGGRNFAYAGDVAEALLAAADHGRPGRCYLAGGENLSYLDFFTRVARIQGGLRPPRLALPASALLAAGAAGSAYARLTGRPAALNLTVARLSLLETYYSSARAVDELGMPCTPVDTAIAESIQSLKEYGHIH